MNFRKSITTCLAATLLAGAGMTPAFGQDDTRQFSVKSGKVVNNAMELANKQETEKALNILEKTVKDDALNPYERSTIYQMIGQYSYELDRSVEAQQAFDSAILAGGLLPKEIDNIKLVVAQLMIGNGQFREGAERLEEYLHSSGEHKPQHIDLLVNAWVQAEDYQRALPWAEKWLEPADRKARKHYELLYFLYTQLGQDEKSEIMKQALTALDPEKENRPYGSFKID